MDGHNVSQSLVTASLDLAAMAARCTGRAAQHCCRSVHGPSTGTLSFVLVLMLVADLPFVAVLLGRRCVLGQVLLQVLALCFV